MQAALRLARSGAVALGLSLSACLAPGADRPGAGTVMQPVAAIAPRTAPAPQPPVAPARPRYGLDDLVAMTAQGLRDLLGEPGLLRREGPGEMWRYVGAECVLFLFLYPGSGAQTGPAQVTHAEFGARDNGAEPETAGCIDALVMRQRG